MKKILILFLILFSVFVKSQTTYLMDEFEYTTNANLIAAYVPDETYGEILSHDMTSNTAPSPYIAVASTEYSTSYKAFRAFDYNETGGDATYWQANTSTGTLRQYTSTYLLPTSYVVEAPSANASTYSPKNWTFECSRDGTSWTTCGTETNQIGWSNSEQRNFNVAGALTTYRYFRINVTANNGGTYLAIGEFYVTGGDCGMETNTSTVKQGTYSARIIFNNNANGQTFTKTITSTNLSGLRMLFFSIRATDVSVPINVCIRDAGGTTTCCSPQIDATNTWYWYKFDISSTSDANKDAIICLQIAIVSVTPNTVYLDNWFITTDIWADPTELIYPVTNVFY